MDQTTSQRQTQPKQTRTRAPRRWPHWLVVVLCGTLLSCTTKKAHQQAQGPPPHNLGPYQAAPHHAGPAPQPQGGPAAQGPHIPVAASTAPVPHPTPPAAPHALPYGNPKTRNWHQHYDTIFVSLDPRHAAAARQGARRAFVVLVAYYFDPAVFWSHFPSFTQRCMLGKSVKDFQFVEAIEVPVQALASGQLRVDGALGAYYAFVLVEKSDGALQDATVIGITRQPSGPQPVPVRNPQRLVRQQDKQLWPQCR